jgi:cytochrome c551/c552
LAAAKPAQSEKVPTFNDVKAMMASYTCLSCHNPDRKLVGPSFKDIAKRKYSPEKILQLIHNPQPENWPEYPTPMPPMPQVKKEDGLKIAAYINSLR